VPSPSSIKAAARPLYIVRVRSLCRAIDLNREEK
jgi:hypothetical protein